METSLATLQQAIDEHPTCRRAPCHATTGRPTSGRPVQRRVAGAVPHLLRRPRGRGDGRAPDRADTCRLANDNVLVAAYGIPESDVVTCLQGPIVMIGSDGILGGPTTTARGSRLLLPVLGRYVREEDVSRSSTASPELTIMPAEAARGGRPGHGRKDGHGAAPMPTSWCSTTTIADRASVEDRRESVGIDWVLMRGHGEDARRARPGPATWPGDHRCRNSNQGGVGKWVPWRSLRIVERSMLGPGAISTHLADLGADVIKVEPPTGDYIREMTRLGGGSR